MRLPVGMRSSSVYDDVGFCLRLIEAASHLQPHAPCISHPLRALSGLSLATNKLLNSRAQQSLAA